MYNNQVQNWIPYSGHWLAQLTCMSEFLVLAVKVCMDRAQGEWNAAKTPIWSLHVPSGQQGAHVWG